MLGRPSNRLHPVSAGPRLPYPILFANVRSDRRTYKRSDPRIAHFYMLSAIKTIPQKLINITLIHWIFRSVTSFSSRLPIDIGLDLRPAHFCELHACTWAALSSSCLHLDLRPSPVVPICYVFPTVFFRVSCGSLPFWVVSLFSFHGKALSIPVWVVAKANPAGISLSRESFYAESLPRTLGQDTKLVATHLIREAPRALLSDYANNQPLASLRIDA